MGGKAFTDTQRINREDIYGTLTWLERHWPEYILNDGKPLGKVMLGSAGKNETSGDIDLNLSIDAYDQAKVANDLIALLGADHVKARPGNNQIFTSIPINGDAEAHGRVQVDFMFGNFEWQKFSYFSAGKTDMLRWGNSSASYFKGLYRTEMIKAITAYCSDWVLEDKGEIIARVGPTFFHDRGLLWRYRLRPMRQDGTARVKEFKELSKEEFLKVYPSAVTALTDKMDDPKKVVEYLFNGRGSVSSVDTLESISMYMNRAFDSDARRTICAIFLERLNNLKVEVPIKDFKHIYLQV